MNNKYNNIIKQNKAAASATLTIALVGNPNSGKTTLFNLLTGSNQKVGNWPGVTVEQKTGVCQQNTSIAIVDTPGIYSLSPFTLDEQVTHDYLVNARPDLIVNIVDATNLERNLLLTSQLLELDTPVVVALNMCDEAQKKGIAIDTELLQAQFGVRFFPISAAKNDGVDQLMTYCASGVRQTKLRFKYGSEIEAAAAAVNLTTDTPHRRWLQLKELGDELTAKVAEERYLQISQIVSKAQKVSQNNSEQKAQSLTEKIDKIVLNKWLAFPMFFAVMAAIFYLSIGAGGLLTDLINDGLTPLLQWWVTSLLQGANLPWLTSLVCDGVIGGVMSVVSFVPQIVILFGCIAALEASGYMSRIAFITDRLLNKIGLGGRSFVSMILGCGCSVPAIMATRTIKNVDERNTTITLAPFMPCSAKLAIISFFTTFVLGGNALFAISFYFVSIAAVIIGGLLLKLFRREPTELADTFMMELPTYRAPTLKNVVKQMWERGKAFLYKAGTIIFVASVLLWLLTKFNFRFQFVEADQSMLAAIGKFIAPVFIPLGFNDGGYGWQFSVATLTGIVAKETVVTTLQILLPQGIEGCISALGAYCFVTYNLLTVPCVAAISASFSEQGSVKLGLKSMLFQIALAYAVTLAIYQIGSLALVHTTAFVVVVCVVTLGLALYFAIDYLAKHRGCNGVCAACKRNNHCDE